MAESLSKKLSNYLLENFDVSKTRRGSLKIDDFNLSGNGLATRFFNSLIKPNKKIIKDINEDWLLLSDDDVKKEITNILPTTIDLLDTAISDMDRAKESGEVKVDPVVDFYYDCYPVVDIKSPSGSAKIVHKQTLRTQDIEERAWEKIVNPKQVKTLRELGYSGYFRYNPRDLEPYAEEEGYPVYNTYNPPGHRLERNKEAKLDPRFIKFLDTFFLDSCRDYAYNWIYHSTFKKMETYLVLVGAGGIGKNLLAEALKYLHGVSNFTKAPPSALDSKFNGHLVDSTMVYYDECRFSSDQYGNSVKKNRLKEWSNDYVPVEIKGVDAKNMDIFCSAVIATNNDSDVHLEQLDRKFSVMELTEDRVEKRLGVEDTIWLWKYIKSEDFGDAWLNWLEERIDPEFNIYQEYKGEKFNELVISSLLTWQQELLFNFVLSGVSDKYTFSELKEAIPYFPNSTAKVNDFLINFIWDGESLGKVIKENGINTVLVNEKYRPIEKTQPEEDLE